MGKKKKPWPDTVVKSEPVPDAAKLYRERGCATCGRVTTHVFCESLVSTSLVYACVVCETEQPVKPPGIKTGRPKKDTHNATKEIA
jgi:hypothetical protein